MTENNQPAAAPGREHNSQQMEHRLLRLTAQVETLEQTLATLLDIAKTGQDQLSVLVGKAVDPQREQGINAQLAELAAMLQTQADATERLDEKTGVLANNDDMQALLVSAVRQEQLNDLEKRMAKLVRTQFKSNTLNESQQGQLESALTSLRELAEKREARHETRRIDESSRQDEARNLGRQELAADLLPAIDGLELALENGRAWMTRQTEALARTTAQTASKGEAAATRWQRLRQAWDDAPMQTAPLSATGDAAFIEEMLQETNAWLAGLELVHNRFISLLATDGIQPIDALDKLFDPRLHVAVDTVENSDLAPNTVARVVRRGYQQGNRVIRYAEVLVARAPDPT